MKKSFNIFILSFFPILCFSQNQTKDIEINPNGLILKDLSVGVSRIIYIKFKPQPNLNECKFKGLYRPKIVEFTDGTKIQYGYMSDGKFVDERVYKKDSDDWYVEYLLYYMDCDLLLTQMRYANQKAQPYKINYATGRLIPHPTIPYKYLNEVDLTER